MHHPKTSANKAEGLLLSQRQALPAMHAVANTKTGEDSATQPSHTQGL